MAVRELQVKNNCWAKWYYSSVKCTSSEMPMCPTLTLKLSSGSLSPSVLCAENNKRMRMQEKEREKKRVTEWEECVDNSIGLIADGHSQFLDTPEIITGSLSCVYSLVCHSFFLRCYCHSFFLSMNSTRFCISIVQANTHIPSNNNNRTSLTACTLASHKRTAVNARNFNLNATHNGHGCYFVWLWCCE